MPQGFLIDPLLPKLYMNPVLKFFYSPMVMMSVFLHGLFLLMPLPEKPPAPEKKAEAPKEEAVKLSSVSSLKIAPKPAARVPLAKPAIRPIARAPVMSLARPAAARLLPAPVVPVAPSPVAAAPAAPLPAAAPAAPAVPLAQGQLQRAAVEGEGQVSAAQFYSFFPEPAAFFTAQSIQQAEADPTKDPVPVEGVTNMTRRERMTVAQVKAEVLPQMFPGAALTQTGTYGGGDVYKVQQGSSVGYLVLVKEGGISTSTYIVEWDRDPSLAQAAAPTVP